MKEKRRHRRKMRKSKITFAAICLFTITLVFAVLHVKEVSCKKTALSVPKETWEAERTEESLDASLEIWEEDEEKEDDDEVADICRDLYQKAAEENQFADLETIRSIVNRFGEKGYPAVDSKNQIDMTNADRVLRFCEIAEEKEEAEITIIQVGDSGGFAEYALQAREGKVNVVRSYYKYEKGKMKKEAVGKYQAERFAYGKEGYLMFSGTWFSEELYVLTLSGAEDHAAFRVQPLDETYRDLNRKYLLPIGYEKNNMFLTDWSEEDFAELNFYDMFDILYPKVKGEKVPYTPDENLGVGAVYQIPEDEFEDVIQSCFHIDSKTLQEKTVFHPENAAYEYKPRGFHEVEYPEYPYPEVVGCLKNSDGTITLTVNVVYPLTGNAKVYAHEVTVRPLENGEAQYVSNRIIPSQDNYRETWHTPRLTEERWMELYGN